MNLNRNNSIDDSEMIIFLNDNIYRMTHGLAAAQSQVKNTESSSPYHRKSQSLDAATIAAQLLNGSSDSANVNKRKSYTHNEKFVQVYLVLFAYCFFPNFSYNLYFQSFQIQMYRFISSEQ